VKIIIGVAGKGQRRKARCPSVDAQFFCSSRISAASGCFAGLDLAARKLPKTSHGFAGRALCQKHAPVHIDQGNRRGPIQSSRTIVRVDFDIAVGQVAVQTVALPSPSPRSTPMVMFCSFICGRPLVRNSRGCASRLLRPQRRQAIDSRSTIRRGTGFTDRHNNAAPVWVLAGNRGF